MFPTIFPDGLVVVYATLLDLQRSGLAPGVLRSAVDGGKVFKLVKNTHSAALAVGDPVCYDLLTNKVDFEVTRPTTAALNHLAGVAVGAIGINGFGWIQVWGNTAAIHVDGTGVAIVAGDSLKPVNGTLLAVHDQATGTTPSFQNYLVANTATALATTVPGFVHCL